MTSDITDRFKVIDVDTHISEPEDLWTSRGSATWGDPIPHVVKAGDVGASGDALIVQSVAIDRGDNDDIWIVNGKPGMPESSQPTPVGCVGNSEIPTNRVGMTKALGRFGVRLRISSVLSREYG